MEYGPDGGAPNTRCWSVELGPTANFSGKLRRTQRKDVPMKDICFGHILAVRGARISIRVQGGNAYIDTHLYCAEIKTTGT